MNKHERGRKSGRVVASTLGLVLCGLENLQQVHRICRRANVALHEQVDEAGNDICHVEIDLLIEREQSFMSRVVPDLSDRIPERLFVGRKPKALNAFVQISSCTAEMLDQPLQADTEKRASRPRRSRSNQLSFFERFTNVVGHMHRRLEPDFHRPNHLAILLNDQACARWASPYADYIGIYEKTLIHSCISKRSVGIRK